MCCDNCPCSFHFICINPPTDPLELPDGDWFCNKCKLTIIPTKTNYLGPYSNLLKLSSSLNPRVFSIPPSLKKVQVERDKGRDSKLLNILDLIKNPEASILRYAPDERESIKRIKTVRQKSMEIVMHINLKFPFKINFFKESLFGLQPRK